VVHSGNIQEWYSQEWRARTRWLASYPVNILWTLYSQVHLSKKVWWELMDLGSACIDKQVIKFCKLQDELVEGAISALRLNPFVHLQTQMPFISKFCMMN
jgi:hypothetical protein